MNDDTWHTVARHADLATLNALRSCCRALHLSLSLLMIERVHLEFEDSLRRLNAQFPHAVAVAVAGRVVMRYATSDAVSVEVDVRHVSLPDKRVDDDMFHIGAFAGVLSRFAPLRIRRVLDIQVEPSRMPTVPAGFHVAGNVAVSVQAATHSGYQILLQGLISLSPHECMKLWGSALLEGATMPEIATHVVWQSIDIL